MIDDFDEREQDRLERLRKDLTNEENHRRNLAKVFGTPEGLDIAEYILRDLCGFWDSDLLSAASSGRLGKYIVGRDLFNSLVLADPGIIQAILDRRRRAAEKVIQEQKERAGHVGGD